MCIDDNFLLFECGLYYSCLFFEELIKILFFIYSFII